ncbi:MAG: enolase [Candidatus Deianiraeaceae bacterium]|jgi:enolase
MSDSCIEEIYGIEILDSRGNPTIEVNIILENGITARGIAPSGASTGTKEAYELRDGDEARYNGKGVQKAIEFIDTEIAPALEGLDIHDNIDELLIELDGTDNKSRLGANTILATSIACWHAKAEDAQMPLFEYIGGKNADTLPTPMMNIINGGEHASNNLAIQEFMVVPHGFDTFAEKLRAGTEVFHKLKSVISKSGHSTAVGDEGGFAPHFNTANEALDCIVQAIQEAGYKANTEISIALDIAASEFYKNKKYTIDGQILTTEELIEYYANLMTLYPITSIEDPFHEGDIEGFKNFTKKFADKLQIVGDDIFCTNPKLITEGIDGKYANALLVKPNQIGTISETLKAVKIAQSAGFKCVMSHRSGETEDTTIAHLAVATNCGQIKTGAPSRVDRTAKYNELLRIETLLNLF